MSPMLHVPSLIFSLNFFSFLRLFLLQVLIRNLNLTMTICNMKWKISKMQQPRHRWYLSHDDQKGVCQLNLKIMANCLHWQILFWKFFIFLVFPTGWNGESRESPGRSPPFSRNSPVDYPNQFLIAPLNNDFQVIIQYKLHLCL